ncbi:unnamed protein product [Strongylus vulgaris]|uniref:Uncharacterized protein n=1 Tax=Strongylus vulgaris TaxID=40348 RepID=A0A3P7JG30_STRVU|nr:unnamed protein product [Strongylus vulgaris]
MAAPPPPQIVFNPPCVGCAPPPPQPTMLFGSVPCCSITDFSCCSRLFRKRHTEGEEKSGEKIEEETSTKKVEEKRD